MTASGRAQERAATSELQKAARNGNVRLVRQLLAKGVLPDAQDVDGWTCLHAAAVEGHVTVVRVLCGEETGGAKQGSAADASKAPQMQAVITNEDDVGAELVDVNVATACGRTALYFAAMDGNAECVCALLKHGADPLIRCKEGKTPLDVAELFERCEVQTLLKTAINSPRLPIKRRPTRIQTKGTDEESSASELVAIAGEEVPYVPPEPEQWRKSDFTKWSNITDKDWDAIDAHQQRAAQDAARVRIDSTQPSPTSSQPSLQTEPMRARNLPYGEGRIGPPKSVPPGHARYQDYKEWLEIQEEITRARKGEKSDEPERLLSLKPPPEGGAAPDFHNGCHGMGYTWGQTPSEVHVWIVVAHGTRRHDITCEMGPASLSVAVWHGGEQAVARRAGRRDVIFKEAVLWRRIKADESVWTMEVGLLTLTLRKVESGWWRCVTDLEGHTKIDSSLCRGPDMLEEYEDGDQNELRKFFERQLTRKI